ncbi:type II secretion system protein GspM [Solidesulfovibrio sp.]
MKPPLPHPLLLAAGGAALVLGLYLWVALPLADGIALREKRLDAARHSLAEAQRLSAMLVAAGQTPPGEALPEGFSLFSLVESAATQEGVKAHVEFMRPASRDLGGGRREMAVDLRLTGLGMRQFLAFAQRVESPQHGIRIRQLILQPSPKGGVDADLSVAVQTTDKGR